MKIADGSFALQPPVASRLAPGPIPKSYRVGLGARVLSRMALWSFLLLSYINTLSPFFENYTGGTERLGLWTLLLYPVALAFAILLYEQERKLAPGIWYGYLCLYLGMAGIGVVRGFFLENLMRNMVLDGITLFVVVSGFVLGRRNDVWSDARWPILMLSAMSVFVAIKFTDSMVLQDRSILNLQSGSFAEPTLILVPLFAMAAVRDRSSVYYVLAVLVSVGALVVYLYFARRSGLVRCWLELLTACIILPLLNRQFMRGLFSFAVLIGAISSLLYLFPFETLIDRFVGTYGVVDTITNENMRLREIELLFQEVEPYDYAFGRGIGGTFLKYSVGEQFSLDVDSTYGKMNTHAGLFYPFLKGGIPFQITYFLPLFLVIGRVRRLRRLDHLNQCAVFGGTILLIFQVIEGVPSYSTAWVGFGIGLISSRIQNINDFKA